MQVTLRYFPGCPNWQDAEARVREALTLLGLPQSSLVLSIVDGPEDAQRLGFTGSPTVLVDGLDPFLEPGQEVGLTCRLFRTPHGPAGAPTLEQVLDALATGGHPRVE